MNYKLLLLFTFFNLSYCAQKKENTKEISLYAEIKIKNEFVIARENELMRKVFQLNENEQYAPIEYIMKQVVGDDFSDEGIFKFLEEKLSYFPVKDLLDDNGTLKENIFLQIKNLEYKEQIYDINLSLTISYENAAIFKLKCDGESYLNIAFNFFNTQIDNILNLSLF